MSRSVLVRGDDGGLHIRRFSSEVDAIIAEGHRDVLPEVPAAPTHLRGARNPKLGWTTGEVAKFLGISQATVIRRCEAGEMPFTDHGTANQPRRIISMATVRLLRQHGLRGVARMRMAGLI